MNRRVLLVVGLLGVLVGVVAYAAWAGWLAPRHQLRLQASEAADGAYVFSPAELRAPAHTAVSLVFENPSNAPHNLVLLDPVNVSGAIRYPGQSDRLDFTTPAAGSYRFVCNVHEDMSGQLVVEERR